MISLTDSTPAGWASSLSTGRKTCASHGVCAAVVVVSVVAAAGAAVGGVALVLVDVPGAPAAIGELVLLAPQPARPRRRPAS